MYIHFKITIMDSILEVHEDVVSDPLKHLLSLDWNPSVTVTTIENNFEPTKSVKRVRFSDEVEKISYDSGDEKNLDISFSHEENSNDKKDNTEMNVDLPAYSNENKTNIFNEETEFTNFELPFEENTVDSVVNDINDNSLINFNTEIKVILQGLGDSVNENADQNSLLLVDNYENSQLMSAVYLQEEGSDLNEVANQVENLTLENTSLENITSVSPVKFISKLSDFKMHISENPVDELKSNSSDGSSIASKRRVKNKLYNQKQSWKLNSVLTENSSYSSASELNSAVFKAWCEVKNKTKIVETAVSIEKNVSNKQSSTNSAYLTWKKSKTEALKKPKKDKPNSIFSNMHQENSKNSKEENEMAFKAWKKKKDEMLKQKVSEKFDEEQEQVVESLMEKKEKKMEADAAFTACRSSWETVSCCSGNWTPSPVGQIPAPFPLCKKQHKSHLMKIEKKKRAWVMQKKREEEEKKVARDREALIAYRMWLESKNSVKHDTFSPVKAKPPWIPPGK
ncbi:unnamed protein product [Larinioides sclopetarius]|uniref:Uncharacterized protein n=1 Tax=Larinioides sclopetarius TaxID=280406 RepID=A0AAV1ZY52_9ARAC